MIQNKGKDPFVPGKKEVRIRGRARKDARNLRVGEPRGRRYFAFSLLITHIYFINPTAIYRCHV